LDELIAFCLFFFWLIQRKASVSFGDSLQADLKIHEGLNFDIFSSAADIKEESETIPKDGKPPLLSIMSSSSTDLSFPDIWDNLLAEF
jgi:hypothetical protein